MGFVDPQPAGMDAEEDDNMPNLENGEENAANNASDTDEEEDNSAFDHMVSLNDKITYALSA